MKKTKSNLDELQELKLLKIEHNGCWLAFWGLLAVILTQIAIGNGVFTPLAGWKKLFLTVIVGSVLLTAYLLVIQHYCDWTQMAYPWAVKLGLVLGVVMGAAVLYIGTLAVCGYRLSALKASEVD